MFHSEADGLKTENGKWKTKKKKATWLTDFLLTDKRENFLANGFLASGQKKTSWLTDFLLAD